jgi:hypothetical protein
LPAPAHRNKQPKNQVLSFLNLPPISLTTEQHLQEGLVKSRSFLKLIGAAFHDRTKCCKTIELLHTNSFPECADEEISHVNHRKK